MTTRRLAERVGLGEVASLQERNPRRAEIARRRQPDRNDRQLGGLHGRRAFGWPRTVTSLPGGAACRSTRPIPRPGAREYPRARRRRTGSAVRASRTSARGARRGREQVAGVEAGINPAQAVQAAHQQAGANQQHQRQRDLRHDQQVAYAPVHSRRTAAAGPLFEASLASRPVICHAGANAAARPVTIESAAAKARTRPSTATSCARGSARRTGHERVDAVGSRQEAGDAAADTEQHALGQQLLHDAQPAGAERPAQRNLPGAPVSPHQHQVGEVGAGDEQHQGDGAEQDEQRRARVTDQVFVQGDDQRTPVLVVGGILRRQPQRNRVEVGLGPLDGRRRASAFRPRDSCGCRAPRDRPVSTPAEPTPSHPRGTRGSEPRPPPCAGGDPAAGSGRRCRIGAESRAPERLAQQDRVRPALSILIGDEAAPEEGLQAEIGRKLDDARMLETASGSPWPVRV